MPRLSDTTLTRDAVIRVLVSLISAEQRHLIKSGAISGSSAIDRLVISDGYDAIGAVQVAEDGLGFDSLARLELILLINRFFGLHTTGVEDYLVVQDTVGEWVDLIMTHLGMVGDGLELTFSTSGSAGPPKHITHPIAHLMAEVTGLTTGPFAASPGRILSLVPARHIYGFLFTALLPHRLGVPLIDLSYGAPQRVFREAQANDLIIATPYTWGYLGRSGLRFEDALRGVTSGGPSDASTWAIRDIAGLSNLTEVYGATETGGIGVRTDADAPFTLMPHLRRKDDAILGPKGKGALPLQDTLSWTGPRAFTVLGRKDDVVQIGGVNVSPRHVEGVIRQLPNVADVAVRIGDGRLRAFVVLSEPGPVAADAMRQAIKMALPGPAQPTEVSFGANIPVNEMGKRTDWDPAPPAVA